VDRLTDKALLTETIQQRARLYARVQKRLAALLPVIPLWWPENVVVTSRRLKGFSPHPSGDLLGLASAELLEEPPPVDTSPEGRAAREPLR
jgi:ABC-type transport system substrate-binding protein